MHTYAISATNQGGGNTLVTVTVSHGSVKIDSIVVTTAAPPPATPTNLSVTINADNTAFFVFSLQSGVAGQCRIDGGDWQTCSSPWKTAALAAGSHTLWVRAINGGLTSQTAQASVTINALNTPPSAITLSGVQTLTAGSLSSGQSIGTLSCTDAESATCTYTLVSQSMPGAFSLVGAAMQVANAGLAAGSYTITVEAKDAGGLTKTDTKTIVVNAAANHNPNAFAAITPIAAIIGTAGSTSLPTTTDPDGDTLTYSIVGSLPTGFSFTSGTRLLSWTTGTTAGNYTLTYRADDGKGGSTTSAVTVNVSAAVLVNHAPVANPDTSSTAFSTPVTLNVLANDTDADGDTLSVTGATVVG